MVERPGAFYTYTTPTRTMAVGSPSQIGAVAPSEPAASSSAPRAPTSVITYSYASRLVYVAPAETYDVRSRFPPHPTALQSLIDLLDPPHPGCHRYRQGVLPGTQRR